MRAAKALGRLGGTATWGQLRGAVHRRDLQVPGLAVQPQHRIADSKYFARVDLADERLQLVIEADSFEFHGHGKQLGDDCRRYTQLGVRGG